MQDYIRTDSTISFYNKMVEHYTKKGDTKNAAIWQAKANKGINTKKSKKSE